MTFERQVLLALLKLTCRGPVHRELLPKDAKIPSQTVDGLLETLSHRGFFDEYGGLIEASPSQRVRMAVEALRLAADSERVCGLLSWGEFESIAAQAFEDNGYTVARNLRFKQSSRRWEIDVVGFKKPSILCVDCKHWKRGWRQAATAKAVEAQTRRTEAFAKAVPGYRKEASLHEWETATLVPIVLSLTQGPYRLYNNVPIVPVLQLQDFINELPAHIHLLKNFRQKQLKLDSKLQPFNQ